MPMAEAMACGLPIIVPEHGPCLDFCDRETAFMVPAEEVPYSKRVPMNMVAPATVAEVNREELAARMRQVFENYAAAQEVGRRGSARIRREFTWDRAAALAADRLEELAQVAPLRAAPSAGRLVSYGKDRLWAGDCRAARSWFGRAVRTREAWPEAHAYFLVACLPLFAINLLRKLQMAAQHARRWVARAQG